MKPPKWLYQNSYIYGINFKSRGQNCRESCEATLLPRRYGQQLDNYEPSNSSNKLQLIWSEKNIIQVGVVMLTIVQTNTNMVLSIFSSG